ncbi:unnamed protein product [Timema podura]|uniref:Serpin domain-containing protein n=1 Tax=Timema podura TaxID=61482 RepID=A0ABN7NV74_TIMPD|nr:unnamed protein product [Timema podura]
MWSRPRGSQRARPRTSATRSGPRLQERVVTINGKKEFANSQPGDVLFSPLGVKFILAFLKLGARGETSKQISKVLSLPSDKKIKESMKGLLDKFDKNFQMILNLLLQAAFTSRDFGYIDSLIQELENEYHLLILLPNKVDGLAHLEQQLIQTNLQKLRLGYKVPDLVVHIPSFNFISRNDIGKHLKARMSILFSRNNANLSGIAPKSTFRHHKGDCYNRFGARRNKSDSNNESTSKIFSRIYDKRG